MEAGYVKKKKKKTQAPGRCSLTPPVRRQAGLGPSEQLYIPLSLFLPLAISPLTPLHRSYLKVHGQCVQVCLVIEHARRVTHPYFPHVKK